MEQGEVNVTRGFKVSGMPLAQWKEWENSSIADFGNCYWLKLWSDHEKAKQFNILFNQIFRKLEEHDIILDTLIPEEKEVRQEKEQEERKVKTFGE